MGKAARWLKGLLGMKKDKDKGQVERYPSVSYDEKEKKRSSFAKSGKGSPRNVPNNKDGSWLRSYIAETEKDQNKHAIAVAAATAAAADAAVAAAKAAMEVVKLTSNGRGGREKWAAMKIQTLFRGYLSRKALRALKGLVRLQALVRGYLVRKRAIATLHSMQALLRAQTTIRSQRICRSFNKESSYCLENKPRKSSDEPRSEIHSKRLSTSMEANAHDDCPKVVEIDTLRTRSRSRRFNLNALSECGDDLPYRTILSPLPCPVLASTPHHQNVHDNVYDSEWCFADDECRLSTAQTTPRFSNTPSSVCGDGYFRPHYSTLPSYMANTRSFKAKIRSLSAAKQRLEQGAKRRLSLGEILAARNSISGVRMNRF